MEQMSKGIYFEGYPQVVKQEGSQPIYKVKKEKDITVKMRDGVCALVDVYCPDVEGEKFPAILAWGAWGKDAQEAIGWQNLAKCKNYLRLLLDLSTGENERSFY